MVTLEEACARLKENDNELKKLQLEGIGDTGAIALSFALKHNEFLTELNLSRCSLGPNGIASIARSLMDNYAVERLYLQDNQIGDKGTEALADLLKKNESIRTINIARNRVGNVGAAALSEVLLENKVLLCLYIYENEISCHGASALAQVVANNTTIQELFCWSNKFGDAGLQELARASDKAAANERIIQLRTDWKSPLSSPSHKRTAPRRKVHDAAFFRKATLDAEAKKTLEITSLAEESARVPKKLNISAIEKKIASPQQGQRSSLRSTSINVNALLAKIEKNQDEETAPKKLNISEIEKKIKKCPKAPRAPIRAKVVNGKLTPLAKEGHGKKDLRAAC